MVGPHQQGRLVSLADSSLLIVGDAASYIDGTSNRNIERLDANSSAWTLVDVMPGPRDISPSRFRKGRGWLSPPSRPVTASVSLGSWRKVHPRDDRPDLERGVLERAVRER